MSANRRMTDQRGFSLIEVVICLVIVVSGLGVATSLTATTTELVKDDNIRTRLHAEHRRSLLTIGNVLRTASLQSLAGFTDSVATEPVFRRVTGVALNNILQLGEQRLQWRAADADVPGVEMPGALWLVSDGEATLVADRVPAGGFSVRMEGSVLAIELSTYYATDLNHTAQFTSETAVYLRN